MKIVIIDYPFALRSAVFGLQELFDMANGIAHDSSPLSVEIKNIDQLSEQDICHVVILPPALREDYYLAPCQKLRSWLRMQYESKTVLCSACAGAFVLAHSRLLEGKIVTTHWGLAERFRRQFPELSLDSQQILIDEGSIVTAGGLMSWVDLGLNLVERFMGASVMHLLGKHMVIDTGKREQSYYSQFTPNRDHGDRSVLEIQHYIDRHYRSSIKNDDLALLVHLSERTLLRRFVKATGYKPSEYIQAYRIQKVCECLERTQSSFDKIAYDVGYTDSGACRKAFVKRMGLTPKEFRSRFIR